MTKYKVGDKVRIVDERTWDMSSFGDMDKYLGTIMTITFSPPRDEGNGYQMKEDGRRYSWTIDMIEGLANDKVELHPDFAEWYEEITNRWTIKDSAKAFAIYLINQIGFGHLLEDAENNIVEEKYKELSDDMNNDKEKYTRAILDDNWTVRKEKLYYVELPAISFNDRFLNTSIKSGECFFSDSKEANGYKHKFTEKEIKAIDERYWNFAKPVLED